MLESWRKGSCSLWQCQELYCVKLPPTIQGIVSLHLEFRSHETKLCIVECELWSLRNFFLPYSSVLIWKSRAWIFLRDMGTTSSKVDISESEEALIMPLHIVYLRERSLEAQTYHELCVDLLPKMASLAWVAHFCDFPPINLHKRQMSMTLIIMSG